MDRCDQKKGLFGYCKKESLHPGDHDNGKTTWSRTGLDLRIYQKAIAVRDQLRTEQLHLDEIARSNNQRESAATASNVCGHSYRSHMEFGDIKVKGDPAYSYREFWHVTTCAKCGQETDREGDEYYGDDMADIHWKWRQ